MNDVRKQMEQLRDELEASMQAFVERQQVAQYFVEVYLSDVFANEFETDAEIDAALQTAITQMFGTYLVFTPDVATLFAHYAEAGLMMYDEYEGNYIQLPSVKADALMEALATLPEGEPDVRAQQAVATFERFAKQQTVIDVADFSVAAVQQKNAYLYLTLLYLHATTESTLQQMIYLQQYLQHIEVVYLTPAAQASLITLLTTKGYVSGEGEALHLTQQAADFYQGLEMQIEAGTALSFEQQVEMCLQ